MALSSRLKVLSWSVVLVSSAGLAQVEPPVCTGASRVFTATGQVQSFVVPAGVTSVTIDAAGAAGGAATDLGTQTAAGGSGARLVASFAVTPGETLSVVVGAGGGSNVVSDSGGGGGASYVYRTATASGLLLAAAGGGGAFETVAGGDGQVGAAQAGGGFGVPGAAGSGGNGGGGGTGYCNTGAGGGGLLTDGGDGFNDVNCGGVPVGGGKALANGSAGGTAASGSNGGFGGGGGGGSSAGGGGGGGYNGGGGGSLGPALRRVRPEQRRRLGVDLLRGSCAAGGIAWQPGGSRCASGHHCRLGARAQGARLSRATRSESGAFTPHRAGGPAGSPDRH